MKKTLMVLFFLTAVLALGAISDSTTVIFGPACVTLNQPQHFSAEIRYASPDLERLIFAQFATGNFWHITAVQDPHSVDVPGTWSHSVNAAGNNISWSFTAASGHGGGDVGNGASITFTFDATATAANDLNVGMYIEGDQASSDPPHTKSWSYAYNACGDDDDDDDTTADDDDNDNDDNDDDATADDDAAPDDDASPSAPMSEGQGGSGNGGCGC